MENRGPWVADESRQLLRIWPPSPEVNPAVPSGIAATFREAHHTMENGSFLAAALMCRRVLELLCKHFKVKGVNLKQQIDALHAAGVVDDRLRAWAHVLRDDGNSAAHDEDADTNITAEDARELVDFTDAILEYVFVLRARFDAFQARRAARGKP